MCLSCLLSNRPRDTIQAHPPHLHRPLLRRRAAHPVHHRVQAVGLARQGYDSPPLRAPTNGAQRDLRGTPALAAHGNKRVVPGTRHALLRRDLDVDPTSHAPALALRVDAAQRQLRLHPRGEHHRHRVSHHRHIDVAAHHELRRLQHALLGRQARRRARRSRGSRGSRCAGGSRCPAFSRSARGSRLSRAARCTRRSRRARGAGVARRPFFALRPLLARWLLESQTAWARRRVLPRPAVLSVLQVPSRPARLSSPAVPSRPSLPAGPAVRAAPSRPACPTDPSRPPVPARPKDPVARPLHPVRADPQDPSDLHRPVLP